VNSMSAIRLLVAALAVIASCASVASAQATVRPFEPIQHERVALPDGVMPWAATWAPDGRHIVFHDYNGGQEWIANADGRRARCVSCGFDDRPAIVGAFAYLLPDNKRMFIANELGDVASILECAPSVADCREHRYLTVDLSADDATSAGKPNLGRRTYHLAPDGEHLAYSMVRLDSLIMMVARLERTDGGYRAVDHRVINPTPPTSLLDRSAERWANGSQLFEFKSFADGGRSAIIVGEPESSNVDMLKVDLATGETTRLTGHPDWDEDGAPSPDGRHLVVGSWRGMERVAALGTFPNPPFLTYPFFAAVAGHYVSSRAGFQCDIQPWLLGSEGDAGGALAGQPLAPYRGGNDIIGNNLAGHAFWSPDSTRVLVQERRLGDPPADANAYVQQKGTSPSRLLIARLDRSPTEPVPTVRTEIGDWASTPQQYTGAFGFPGVTTVDGPAGGTATIVRDGNVASINGRVTYDRYSDDGRTFIDGTEEITGSPVRDALRYVARLRATDAKGKEIGHADIDLTFQQKTPSPQPHAPPSTVSGHAEAEFKGRKSTGIPEAAPCPNDMPRPSQLEVAAHRVKGAQGIVVKVRVTATILGDTRPVRRARVKLAGRRAFTDDEGLATIPVKRGGRRGNWTAVASAGDTFDPGRAEVRSPSR
jgi:hypothetical protein